MSRTLQELAKEAWTVQDASNLCGVAQSFARAMVDLQPFNFSPKSVGSTGKTEGEVRLAIITLWMDKMAQLSKYDTTDPKHQEAYEVVMDVGGVRHD